MLLHHLQELDNDLGTGANQDLALATLLGIVDALERIVQDGRADHVGGIAISHYRLRGFVDLFNTSRRCADIALTKVRFSRRGWVGLRYLQHATRAPSLVDTQMDQEVRIKGVYGSGASVVVYQTKLRKAILPTYLNVSGFDCDTELASLHKQNDEGEAVAVRLGKRNFSCTVLSKLS